MGWEKSDGIREEQGSNPGICSRCSGRRADNQPWPRLISSHLVGRPLVGEDVLLAQLLHDLDSDLGVQGDLVPQGDVLETRRH